MRFQRAAILGVGLIGGSVAAAIRHAALAGELVGYSPGGDAERARELGLVDRTAPSAAEAVRGADLVVLGAPIPAIPGLLRDIAPAIEPGALVTDCSSTKRGTVDAARSALGAKFPCFVPGHPIAGRENHGPTAARAELFRGAAVILCPQPETAPDALERARALWRELGARVVEMAADEHDALFAEVSHWPHVVAYALCGAIAAGERAGDSQRFAGGGLRDTTRIGASSPPMWADILLDNRENVLRCAQSFETELRALADALRAGDRDELIRRFGAAAVWRRGLG
jgi:prephenate dehydrogenase